MKKLYRALWRRRLAYRRKRMHYWLAKGNTPKAKHWARRVNEAKDKLGLPVTKKAKGIDVYEGDGDIDWHKVKGAGHYFAICKVSEGVDFRDKSWSAKRVKAMRQAEVRIGVYHFLRPKPGRSGADEMQFFIAHARSAGWGKPGDIRPVIDFEATTMSPARTLRYLIEAINECKKLTGKPPIIYTGGPFWNENTGSCKDSFGCQLWLAAYVKNPEQYLPAAWKKSGWAIWQHTDQGAVPGVQAKNVDQNIAKRLPLL